MKKKIKIVFYIKDPNGGTGRFIEQLQRLLSRNNLYEIRIFTHIKPSGFFLKAEKIGISTKKQVRLSPFSFIIAIFNIVSLYRKILAYKPDVLISMDVYANMVSSVLRPFFPRTKLVHSTHVNLIAHISNGRNPFFTRVLKSLILLFYKKSDCHYVPSKGLRQQLITEFFLSAEKIVHIPYPLDFNQLKGLAEEPIKSKECIPLLKTKRKIKIFTMGRFDNQKNFLLLFKVFQVLLHKHPNIDLCVLGSGNMTEEYKQIVTKLQIVEHVHFLGWQKNPYQYLRYADMFILLTNYEGLPYVLLETQGLSIYTMSSDVDFGPREILREPFGSLIKTKNTSEIVLLIEKAVKRKEYLKIKHKKNIFIKQFDSSVLESRYLTLFKPKQ